MSRTATSLWKVVSGDQQTSDCLLSLVMCAVSHTTDDLIFEWYPTEEIPLVVEPIQLPQLELIHNATEDCTATYSTGNFTCLMVVFKLTELQIPQET